MKFLAEIEVMPHKELLDPQGKAVANNIKNLDISGVEDVRIGKHINITLTAESVQDAEKTVDMACKNLLANPIIETYTFSVRPVTE